MVIDPTDHDLGATTVVAPGLMLDDFLPIPDAKSLPFYPSVLKLVVLRYGQRLDADDAHKGSHREALAPGGSGFAPCGPVWIRARAQTLK